MCLRPLSVSVLLPNADPFPPLTAVQLPTCPVCSWEKRIILQLRSLHRWPSSPSRGHHTENRFLYISSPAIQLNSALAHIANPQGSSQALFQPSTSLRSQPASYPELCLLSSYLSFQVQPSSLMPFLTPQNEMTLHPSNPSNLGQALCVGIVFGLRVVTRILAQICRLVHLWVSKNCIPRTL